MFRDDYFYKTLPHTEKSYRITNILDIPNDAFRGLLEIRVDNTDFIENSYLNKYRFLYKDKKLYINLGEFTAIQGYGIIAPRFIENSEHLWNILKDIDNNSEVINLITKVLSCIS